ncbi:hypothetical protein [Pseudopelagicola sp. nBUS_19]
MTSKLNHISGPWSVSWLSLAIGAAAQQEQNILREHASISTQ